MFASLALAVAIQTNCSWDNPGANPYRSSGDVTQAVDHYGFPKATADKLKSMMRSHKYTDVAEIKKDSIKGQQEYINLRSMHFGRNQICTNVSQAKWTGQMIERGLVYCADGHCLIVPTVCNNVSLVDVKPPPTAKETPTPEPGEPSLGGGGPLVFEPPGAGIPPETAITPPMFTEPPSLPPLISQPPGLPPFSIFPPIQPPIVVNPPPHVTPPVIPPPVDEPETIALMIMGLAGLAWIRRKDGGS